MKMQKALFALLRRTYAALPVCILVALVSACGDQAGPPVLTADMPLHLEDHLDAAVVEGSELPSDPLATVQWHFDEPQPDWKRLEPTGAIERTTDALRVNLLENPNGTFGGGVYLELPDWHEDGWSHVIVRTRTSGNVRDFGIFRNRAELAPGEPWGLPRRLLVSSPPIPDGLVHTYRIPLQSSSESTIPWQRLGLAVRADEPGTLDILSATLVPRDAVYAEAGAGTGSEVRELLRRRVLYSHAPARLEYRVRIPEGGRLDFAPSVVPGAPVTFRVTANAAGEEPTTLYEESFTDTDRWAQRSVDLSHLAGRTVSLGLEADAERPGTVALWATPTLSGARATDKPNIIFYVIDGGWADDMSVYGYNRRTTPNLERLAAEGAVFERAYSNASATSMSTPSFMTSLPFSALGTSGPNQYQALPVEALTMAERLHGAGYLTGVFTSNPNAGAPSGLDRGVDLMRDDYVRRDYTSSVELHESYWDWRDAFSAEPYWAHFQTTDVHEYEGGRLTPVPPFSGMYVTAGRRREFYEEWERFYQSRGTRNWDGAMFASGGLEAAGIDRVGFFETMRGLYDESLAHQDYQIGQLVDRLRGRGEWENTLLIVAADHAIEAALWDLGALLQDTMPPEWSRSLLRASITRVPLILVWPGHIRGGQRFDDPVSMIDVLPTVLDLVGLPMPDVAQGQSLAPLLRGEPGWMPRPVIFDDGFWPDETGDLQGLLDMIDGRWGASMWVGPPSDDPAERRPWPVLVFDVWADPWALRPINEQRPDLVEKYTTLLEEQLKAHQALAARFTPGAELALTPEQIERLRSLGYIR